MLVDSLKVYNKIQELNINCASCGSFDHLSSHCNLISYRPHPAKIIEIFQNNSKQKRKKFFRHNRAKFKNLKDRNLIEDSAKNLEKNEEKFVDAFNLKYLALESEFDSSSNESIYLDNMSLEGNFN